MMATDTAASLDIAVEEAPVQLSVVVCPDDRRDVELLRDLVVAEHQRQTGGLDEATDVTLANALQMALRRFGTAPFEPLHRAVRVTGTHTGQDPVEYAKVGAVWVSPADTGGRTWQELVVTYDELTVDGGDPT